MKTYKEFITEVLKPDKKTRESLIKAEHEKLIKLGKTPELRYEIAKILRYEDGIKKEKNFKPRSKDELLKWLEKNKDDPKCRSALKLFQNDKTPTYRQLQGIEQMIGNRTKMNDDFRRLPEPYSTLYHLFEKLPEPYKRQHKKDLVKSLRTILKLKNENPYLLER